MAVKVPTFDELMNPLLTAMQALGGSGSVEEIYDKVVELERFPDDVVAQPHDPEKSNQTELGYRLAWARTYLKKYGLLENSSRGIWALTAKAKGVEKAESSGRCSCCKGFGEEGGGEGQGYRNRCTSRGLARAGMERKALRHPYTKARSCSLRETRATLTPGIWLYACRDYRTER